MHLKALSRTHMCRFELQHFPCLWRPGFLRCSGLALRPGLLQCKYTERLSILLQCAQQSYAIFWIRLFGLSPLGIYSVAWMPSGAISAPSSFLIRSADIAIGAHTSMCPIAQKDATFISSVPLSHITFAVLGAENPINLRTIMMPSSAILSRSSLARSIFNISNRKYR